MAKKSGKSGWPALRSKMKSPPAPKGTKNGAGKTGKYGSKYISGKKA